MAPSSTADNTSRNMESLTPLKTVGALHPQHREPLKLTGALDGVDYFDVTPCIGREYRGVDLAEWLKAPNSDELLRNLAITSKSFFWQETARKTWSLVDESTKLTPSLVSQRGVVFFRKQDGINDENQKELMQRLGELSGKPSTSRLHIHPIYPVSEEARAYKGNDDEISVISSKFKEKSSKVFTETKQSQAMVGDKRESKVYTDSKQSQATVCGKKQSMRTEWHSDIAFEHVPADYTMLRLTELPQTGGGT